MKLTRELKAEIDAKAYEDLLSRWLYAPVDDEIFAGGSGLYWMGRMEKLFNEPGGKERHYAAMKKFP